MKRIAMSLVLAIAGCSANGEFLSPAQVQEEFAVAQSQIRLPVGYSFVEMQVPDSAATYERGFGYVEAEGYAQCAWLDHWLESFENDNSQDMEQSLSVLTEFRSGFTYRNADPSYKRGFERVLDSMSNATPDLVARELDINCPVLTRS